MSKMGDNRLTALAGSIRDAQQAISDSSTAIAEKAIEVGHALIEAKALIKHGQWRAWLLDHCGISERSAQRYMQLANSGMKSATVADLGIRGASEAVGKKSPVKPVDMEALAEAVVVWFSMLLSWSGKSPSARQKARLDVTDCFMNGAEEWEKLVGVWLKQTKAIEEQGGATALCAMTPEQTMIKARSMVAELLPHLAGWLPSEGRRMAIVQQIAG